MYKFDAQIGDDTRIIIKISSIKRQQKKRMIKDDDGGDAGSD